jgi:multidrug resistance efflux pump
MTWKRILILALVLVAAGTAIGFFWPRREAQTLVLPGLVEIQEVRLGSKIGGRVKTIETREGYIASPNQTLVTLDVPELEAQRRQAEARLQQAQFDLEKARNGPRAEEKEAARMAMEAARQRYLRVKNGPRPEEIVQARNDLKSAEADLQLALDRFDRAEQLLKRKAISTEEYEAARSNRDRLRAVVGKMRAYLDQLLRGSRQEDIDEAKAQFDQAQANYNLLLAGTRSEDIGAAEARKAEALGKLQEIEASLREAVVQAPERVVVEVLSVRPGDLVAPNQPMIRVLRADDLWVKAYVPETQLGKVRLNQEVQVTIDSYPDRRFTGTIIQVASEAEFTPRNVQSPDERRYQVFGIKVRVPDPQGIFKSGMAAEVTVPLQE